MPTTASRGEDRSHPCLEARRTGPCVRGQPGGRTESLGEGRREPTAATPREAGRRRRL